MLILKVITSLQGKKELSSKVDAYLVLLVLTKDVPMEVKDISLVQQFLEVFEQLPGLLLAREAEFIVNLELKSILIHRTPYRMTPIELKVLNDQLQELLANGFIRPNISPYGGISTIYEEGEQNIQDVYCFMKNEHGDY